MTVLRDSVSDSVSVNGTSDPSEPKGSKRGMKMFTRFGSLNLKINIKKLVASLLVCCLLFGSLTLSSCSPKNNPASRVIPDFDAISDAVEDEEADVRVNDPDPKDGYILLDTPKGATWETAVHGAVGGVGILAVVAYFVFIARCSYNSIGSDYIPNDFGVTSFVGARIAIAIGAGIGAVIGYGACALGYIDSPFGAVSAGALGTASIVVTAAIILSCIRGVGRDSFLLFPSERRYMVQAVDNAVNEWRLNTEIAMSVTRYDIMRLPVNWDIDKATAYMAYDTMFYIKWNELKSKTDIKKTYMEAMYDGRMEMKKANRGDMVDKNIYDDVVQRGRAWLNEEAQEGRNGSVGSAILYPGDDD